MLADFVREIHDVAIVKKRLDEDAKSKVGSELADSSRRDTALDIPTDQTFDPTERAAFIPENDDRQDSPSEYVTKEDLLSEIDERDTGGLS